MFLNNSKLQGICLENTIITGLASKNSKLLEITIYEYMILGMSRVPKLQKKKKKELG